MPEQRYKKCFPELLHDVIGDAYNDAGWGHSGECTSMVARMGDFADQDINLTGRMTYAYEMWRSAGKAILRLDPKVVEMCRNTDLPEKLPELPELPFDAFWVDLDGEFSLLDEKTGYHKIEGFIVTKDRMVPKGFKSLIGTPSWLILAIGEDRNQNKNGVMNRDDSIQYFGIMPDLDLMESLDEENFPGLQDVTKILVNMILMWSSDDAIVLEAETPTMPKSPKKLARLKRRGISSEKYWKVGVSPTLKQKRAARPDDYDGPMYLATVRGHYRTYWVNEEPPKEKKLAERLVGGKVSYKIRRFIAPHTAWRRGEGTERNVYRIGL